MPSPNPSIAMSAMSAMKIQWLMLLGFVCWFFFKGFAVDKQSNKQIN
jgi:cell division protein FtsB